MQEDKKQHDFDYHDPVTGSCGPILLLPSKEVAIVDHHGHSSGAAQVSMGVSARDDQQIQGYGPGHATDCSRPQLGTSGWRQGCSLKVDLLNHKKGYHAFKKICLFFGH